MLIKIVESRKLLFIDESGMIEMELFLEL